MTLAELIREVRDLVGDEGELYSDTVITRHLNNAQRELGELARGLASWSVTVPAGSESVPRPSALSYPKEAYWQRGTYRWRLGVRYGYPPEHPSFTADPEDVYVVGANLYPYPVPSQDGTLILVGVPGVVAMVSGGDSPSLSGSERVLVAYTVWKLLASTEGAGAANVRSAAEEYLRLKNEWSVSEALRHPPADLIQRVTEKEWW